MFENRVGAFCEYAINRPISDAERELQLNQSIKTRFQPRSELSVISINSSYIKVVDVYYQWKGLISVVALTFMIIMTCIIVGIAKISIANPDYDNLAVMIATDALCISGSGLMIFISSWLLRREAFRHTHYPVRLDRKNRMVHVFRTDGKIESVPWEEVFFMKSGDANKPGVTAGIMAHLLEKDGKTVRYTFALGSQSETENGVMGQWEFFRTYMEEGPKDLIDQVKFCMPVEDRRESYFTGLERLMANFGTGRIIMLPIMLWVSLGRWIAMHTSKIPQWPKEIQETCAIDPKDPYARDARSNPWGLR